MNIYRKYCPNVYVAQCDEEHKKGDIIVVRTRHGKENKHIVHNLVGKKDGLYFYSITRTDGYDNRERAQKKVEKLQNWADSAEKRSREWVEKSTEGRDFLALGEPIKIGHHSEKRHRALIDRNWNRMTKAMDEQKRAEAYRDRINYWEKMANKIDLSMPESLEFFKIQLEEAIEYHKGLKNGTIKREHAYSLTYAKKRVNELKKKYDIAVKLWG